MSFDYYLTVPAEKWPTFDQLQAALDQDRLAITVVRPDGQSGTQPFSNDESEESFGFLFRGLEVRPEGWITSFGEADFQIMEDSFESYRAHEVIEMMCKNDRPIQVGDKLCHISYWDSNVALGVWWYVCATFVKHFGATYYDPQGDGMLDQEALLGMAAGMCGNDKIESHRDVLEESGIGPPKGAPKIVDRIRKFLGLH